jgi:hypothetical protein
LRNGETLRFTKRTLYHGVSCFISIGDYNQYGVTQI